MVVVNRGTYKFTKQRASGVAVERLAVNRRSFYRDVDAIFVNELFN